MNQSKEEGREESRVISGAGICTKVDGGHCGTTLRVTSKTELLKATYQWSIVTQLLGATSTLCVGFGIVCSINE